MSNILDFSLNALGQPRLSAKERLCSELGIPEIKALIAVKRVSMAQLEQLAEYGVKVVSLDGTLIMVQSYKKCYRKVVSYR